MGWGGCAYRVKKGERREWSVGDSVFSLYARSLFFGGDLEVPAADGGAGFVAESPQGVAHDASRGRGAYEMENDRFWVERPAVRLVPDPLGTVENVRYVPERPPRLEIGAEEETIGVDIWQVGLLDRRAQALVEPQLDGVQQICHGSQVSGTQFSLQAFSKHIFFLVGAATIRMAPVSFQKNALWKNH